ncbi:MAG: bifunctional methylenetetrahydrofolate dehydrogenase/methenyltetrahydrofolate cyclohydrolase FolD [Flavobacteriales bacterium]|nr:bifunctional methylenetetrahydrofolate dehydrogenase/methenyltetrahydrofolate cyclohydrolase FolD [Bacteroidota bacterium]MCB9239680.1 bifunctional methylenetetrahydrofolate dehydrogenase/methenyltetrahydrofolate cyclohydrolase FolD [Flavobacteriales bacterium]
MTDSTTQHTNAMILNGKELSNQIKVEIAEQVKAIVDSGKRPPHLAAILVGEDGASKTYVKNKELACERVGFASTLLRLDASTSEEDLLQKIAEINANPDIDGLIVQLPLPKHISENKVTQAIDPTKDVDGFHDVNVGKLTKGEDTFISATPYGIIQLLDRYNIETSGKHCVVVGRSNIVGRPMSILMSRSDNPGNSTVTLCHSRTKNLGDFTRMADILIVALGRPEFVTGDMVKPGATVIDVGISRVDADNQRGYVLKGDVEYDSCAAVAGAITPVPGGVGPMTIIGLLQNTLKSYQLRNA